MYKKVIMLIIFLLLLGACSSKKIEPIDLAANEEQCDTCHMGIEDIQSSAQLILSNGRPMLFDDIGCMVNYLQENDPELEAAFVHDNDTKEWIDFHSSYFIQSSGIQSPMNYGVMAYKTKERAEAMKLKVEGSLYSSEDLLKIDLKNVKRKGTTHPHS